MTFELELVRENTQDTEGPSSYSCCCILIRTALAVLRLEHPGCSHVRHPCSAGREPPAVVMASKVRSNLAVDETVIFLTPPLPLTIKKL